MSNDETDRKVGVAVEDDRIDPADLAAYDAAAVRAEAPRPSGAFAGCLFVGVAILLVAFLYFGFFAAVVFEDLMFGSRSIVAGFPEPVLEFLDAIYSPLIWLIDQFDG